MAAHNGEMNCLFCSNKICFKDGDLLNFQTHMEYEHEVMVAKQELVLAISFLKLTEVKVLTSKMMPRIHYFFEHGEQLADTDIFDEVKDNLNDSQVFGKQIDQIQQMLDDDFSDSDDEFSSVEVQVKQSTAQAKIEEIIIDSDSENEEQDDYISEAISIMTNIKEEEERSNIEIEEKLLEEYQSDEHEVSDIDKAKDTLNDEDINSQQQQILQNVSCKMEIGDNEVGEPQETLVSSPEINSINLVEKFTSLNHCRLCFSSFSNRGNLKKHEETVHIDDQEALNLSYFTLTDLVYSCNMCPQIPGFLTENILNTHKKLQHRIQNRVQNKNTVAKCEVCQKVVKFYSLKAHMLTHTEQEKKHECNLCYKKFLKLRSCQDHQKSIHGREAEYFNRKLTEADLYFSCDRCNFKFVSVNVLKYHQKTHEMKALLNCEFCTSSFENHKLFKIHCLKVHGKRPTIDGSNKPFKCKLCYSGFSRKPFLTVHQKIHKEDQWALDRTLEDEDLKFKCGECDKQFVSANILRYHINKMHNVLEDIEFLRTEAFIESEKKFKCKLCHSKLKSFSNLKAHIFSIHKDEVKFLNKDVKECDLEFRCEECDQRFLSAKILEYHNQRAHNHSEGKVCKLCYKSFAKKRYMLNHQMTMHKNESEFWNRQLTDSDLKFGCSECDKSFVTNDLLKSHGRKHKSKNIEVRHRTAYNEDLGRECQLCYKTFAKTRYMINHQMTQHKNESGFLNRKLTASDLKFNCNQCDKKFVTNNLSKTHQRKHQSEKFEFLRKEAFDELQSRYRCKLCYSDYKFFSNLVSHTSVVHKEEIDLLQRKVENHELAFSCLECDYRFVSETSLYYHNSRCHTENQNTNHCKLCDLEFKKNSGFMQHQYKIHKFELAAFKREYDEKDFIYKCSSCDKKFVTEISLNYHDSKKHQWNKKNSRKTQMKRMTNKNIKFENQERYCQLCYIMYKEPKYLRIHKQRIHADEMEAFEKELSAEDMKEGCTKCGKSFYSRNTLDHHTQRKHRKQLGNNLVPCKLCHITFPFHSVLKKHIEVIHKNEMHFLSSEIDESLLKYDCKLCDLRFVADNILKYHMKYQHKEEARKDIYCEFCNKLFKWTHGRKQVVKNHMKNQHNLTDYKVDEQEPIQKENETVKNFMLLLNSLN